MSGATRIKYYGWSALSLETPDGALFFDPFYRPYCGAEYFHAEDFDHAKYICATHGHEEHFLDVPIIAKKTGATVIGAPSLVNFLKRRNKLDPASLKAIDPFSYGQISVPGFKVTALPWKHRDINLYKALTKAVFHGNATQLSWAWSSATNAPFYSPYTGFHVELPDGTTVLNYNEGFNTKMTDAEAEDLGRRFKTDILLAGMQLNFVDDVVRGVAGIKPKVVILYPPHDKFHAMMGVTSEPWEDFASAVKKNFPQVEVHIADPGFVYYAQ
jgi:L-ascorbate metabolism protein UlaG (beta-lactamase superfamily)